MNIQAKQDEIEAIESTVVTDDTVKEIKEYAKIVKQIAALERSKNALKTKLASSTHYASHIFDAKGHEVASWSHVVRNILDTDRLKTEHQDIYEHYLTQSSYFTFRSFK